MKINCFLLSVGVFSFLGGLATFSSPNKGFDTGITIIAVMGLLEANKLKLVIMMIFSVLLISCGAGNLGTTPYPINNNLESETEQIASAPIGESKVYINKNDESSVIIYSTVKRVTK